MASALYKNLDDNKVLAELETCRKDPTFEFPYGRAWFLKFTIDYELWCRKYNYHESKVIRQMADEFANELIKHYADSKNLDCKTFEYKNVCWVLVQLVDFYKHSGNEANQKVVCKLVQDHLLNMKKSKEFCFEFDHLNQQFFSVFGNWIYLIAKTQPLTTVMDYVDKYISKKDLEPITKLGTSYVHHLGMNWSRAWVFKYLGLLLQKKEFIDAYYKHLEIGMNVHKMIEKEGKFANYDSYMAYDHWIPQFIIYSIVCFS